MASLYGGPDVGTSASRLGATPASCALVTHTLLGIEKESDQPLVEVFRDREIAFTRHRGAPHVAGQRARVRPLG